MLLCRVTFGAMKTECVKNHTNIRKVHKGHRHNSMTNISKAMFSIGGRFDMVFINAADYYI